jgi:hypothetical protein
LVVVKVISIPEMEKTKTLQKKVFETWKINDHKALPITAMNPERIRTLVGGNLSVSKENVSFNGTSYNNVSYQYEYVENIEPYLEGFNISKNHLGINSKKLQAITIECKNINIPDSRLFLLSHENKTLWYHGYGVFFYIEKMG